MLQQLILRYENTIHYEVDYDNIINNGIYIDLM